MRGDKANYLAAFCEAHSVQFTRFDYSGHGESSGQFEHGTLTQWCQDAIEILDTVCQGPQVLVGSSMGGWIATRVAIERPDRTHGLLGIATAPDFTAELLTPALSEQQKATLQAGKSIDLFNAYDNGNPHRIRQGLIDSGSECLVLEKNLPIHCPVRLLHGTADTDVPSNLSQRLLASVASTDAQLLLLKGADHRFSKANELALIENALIELLKI